MPIVNYVREHIRFMEYATDEHLTASERLLWYALMHIMNQRAQGKVWPGEFIRISNDRLLSFCPMKYDTLASARNALKQRGLIEYTKGEKNKLSPAYRINYFFPEYASPDTESDADILQCYTEKSEYTGGNMGGNIGGNMGGNTGGNTGDYCINNNDRPYGIQRGFENNEDEEQLYARAREEAAASWRASFGKDATPAIADVLAWRAVMMGFAPGVLGKAVSAAALHGFNSPMRYIVTVLTDWHEHRVKTVTDAEEYDCIRDAVNGRQPGGMSVAEGLDAMRRFREERDEGTVTA